MKPKKFRLREENKQKYEKPKFKWKKALFLLSMGILAYVVLKAMLVIGQRYFWIIFELIAGVPVIVYVCIVRGRTGTLPTEDMLPPDWTADEKKLFLNQEKERRERGKVCLYISFPFIIAVMMAFITEYYLPMFFG